MESFLFAIDNTHPEHWAYAVRDGIWDTTRRMVKNPISAGDLLYFWQSGKGSHPGHILGAAVALSQMEPRGDRPMPWNGTPEKLEEYKWRIQIQPIHTGSAHRLTWKNLTENTDIPPLQTTRRVPRNQEWLAEQVFGQSKAEAILGELLGAVHLGAHNGAGDGRQAPDNGEVEPVGSQDTRGTAIRAIRLRQGQLQFRSSLLENFCGQCFVTGCVTEALLDAAHITPYRGQHANIVINGLLLRTDIHTLFDRYLLTIVPQGERLVVRIDPDVDSEYQKYNYRELDLTGVKAKPSPIELKIHNALCEFLVQDDES